MPDYEEIIKQSQDNVKSLGEKLKDFDKLHQEIKGLTKSAKEIPDTFNKKFEDIVKLSENYTNNLGIATKNYLDGNNTLFATKLNELSVKIKEFEEEIARLVNTDFVKLFKDLQRIFIDQTRTDIAVELKRFEEKSTELQAQIKELKRQIERLEQIDLEKHFDKLQKTLSEIFGAINGINLTLTNIIPTLTGITQTLGSVQAILDANHQESKRLLNSFGETTEMHLTSQDNQAAKNMELLVGKIKSILEQNEFLRKDIRMNRIMQTVSFLVIIGILIYVIIR